MAPPIEMSTISLGETEPKVDPSEFLLRFKRHASECISTAYEVEHTVHSPSSDTTARTSLPEDVISLLRMQQSALVDFLNGSGLLPWRTGRVMLIDGLGFALRTLKETQNKSRSLFLTTFRATCAAANDYLRMAEYLEHYMSRLMDEHFATLLASATNEPTFDATDLCQLGKDIIMMFSQDAAFAAERVHIFAMQQIRQTSLAADFFSRAWEDDWARNEVALELMRLIDQHLTKAEMYFSCEFLFRKMLVVTAKAIVCFYIRCLLEKADSVSRRRRRRERTRYSKEDRKPFASPYRALIRMKDDVSILKNSFADRAQGNPTLLRILAKELAILDMIHECLATTTDAESLESFIVVIHKQTGADLLVTRFLVSDLWLLVAHPVDAMQLQTAFTRLQPDLGMVTARLKEEDLRMHGELASDISFVRLDQMLRVLYEDRMAQGIVPTCFPCQPCQTTMEADGQQEIVMIKQVCALARRINEIRIAPSKKKKTRTSHYEGT